MPRQFYSPFLALALLLAELLLTLGSAQYANAQTRLPPTQVYEIIGQTAGQRFGETIACLPSFTAQGSTSIAVGSPSPSVGSSVEVYDGDPPTLRFREVSFAQDERFGHALSWSAGVQLAGNGLTELLMGAASAAPSISPGGVTVYGGPDGSVSYFDANSLLGANSLGFKVKPLLADLNANGRQDFLYSSLDANNNAGAIFIVDVLQGMMTPATIPGTQIGAQFGYALETIQDVDGGGLRDILVGSPSFNQGAAGETGKVSIVSTESQAELFEVFGDQPSDGFGSAIANVGDVDGDGVEDFLVGAPMVDVARPGYARLFRGRIGAPPQALCTLTGNGTALDQFGVAVASVGDVDGDFFTEFAIGAPNEGAGGTVFLAHYNRDTGSCAIVHTLQGAVSGEGFGSSLAGAPAPNALCDANQDMIADLFVGAPSFVQGVDNDIGRVAFFRGNFPVPPTPTPVPPPPAALDLNFKIKTDGTLNGSITLDRAPIQTCAVGLFARTSRRDLSSIGPLLKVDSLKNLSIREARFSAARLRKALCEIGGISYSVHFIARARCDGGAPFYSNVMARQMSCGLEPPLTRSRWEQQLVDQTRFTSAAKKRKKKRVRTR